MKLRCTILASLFAGLLATSAVAARKPTAAERKTITGTVTGFYSYWWYYKPGIEIPGLHVSNIRISTVDRHFAAVDVKGPKTTGRLVLVDRALLWHSLSRWVVVDAPGSEFIGCGVAPPAVNRDLFRGLGGC